MKEAHETGPHQDDRADLVFVLHLVPTVGVLVECPRSCRTSPRQVVDLVDIQLRLGTLGMKLLDCFGFLSVVLGQYIAASPRAAAQSYASRPRGLVHLLRCCLERLRCPHFRFVGR